MTKEFPPESSYQMVLEEESLFSLREQHIYGSSRIGVKQPLRAFSFSAPTSSWLGQKKYEITNHLGNVMAVINDRKDPQDPDNDGFAEHFLPTTLSARDYIADENNTASSSVPKNSYRFGFNGKERDRGSQWGGETHYDSRRLGISGA